LKRIVIPVAVLAVVAVSVLWFLSAPSRLGEDDLPQHTANLANGELMFYAGGCASCHAVPDQDNPMLLGGGEELETPFGVFHVPNISPDVDTGIGGWTTLDFVNAMARGVSPDGAHYYPAFPYTSYQRMALPDIIDLKAFLDTLEPVARASQGHEMAFPYNVRRGIGLWKLRYLDGEPFTPDPDMSAAENRGAYLVTGPSHCGECHTPRDAFGGLVYDNWLAGGPAPEGEGGVPNITPHPEGIGDWSARDITYLLETGFTQEFDSVGGHMARVVRNTAELSAEDREAMAAYLMSVPALPDPVIPDEAEAEADGDAG